MKTVLHKASTRGHADHGWLNTHHTFSFGDYYDPQRMNFGALRVLNDDIVAGGMGFGIHPHANMEIISIPTSGDLEHMDDMGNRQVIKQGDVQVMSAGTGIQHGEKNANGNKPVEFFQIWVMPKIKNIKPRYDQRSFADADKKNRLLTVVSPIGSSDGGVQVNQDTWFSLGNLDKGVEINYNLKKSGNGVYVFVIKGKVTVAGQQLDQRDGMGVSGTGSLSISADTATELLLMEVPMQ